MRTETGHPLTGFIGKISGMRADRLMAVLLLLQQRRHLTAAEAARELEISERTARRDLDALSTAGVPVYATRGRGGGWRLVGGARTDLSGLTEGEARALFLVAGPAAAASPAVKAALRKLVRALPEPFRDRAEAASTAQVLDPHRWGSSPVDRRRPPLLDALRDAVIHGVQVRLGYTSESGTGESGTGESGTGESGTGGSGTGGSSTGGSGATTDRIVHPLGIVGKGPWWYLVAGTEAGRRTFRIDRVSSVDPTGEPVHRPEGFDLAGSWREIAGEVERRRSPVTVRAVCVPHELARLRMVVGDRLDVGDATADGRIAVTIRGHSEYALAGELAGLVDWIEVIGPPGVRDHLATIGAVLAERYRVSHRPGARRPGADAAAPVPRHRPPPPRPGGTRPSPPRSTPTAAPVPECRPDR